MSENFKQTVIIRIPQGWRMTALKDTLSLVRNGLTTAQNKNGNGYPITRIETISDERIDVGKVGFIENVIQEAVNEYKLENGDILFSHINSLVHIGKTAIYDGKPNLLLHGMNLLLLRAEKKYVIPIFLLYKLRHLRSRQLFRNIAKKAVNQASINQTELGRVELLLPPIPEQQKIAEILSTVDEAIEKVDKAIEKMARLKKGLMEQLLSGRLRVEGSQGSIESKGRLSLRVRESKDFQDTEIGRIPKEWEVKKIEDLFTMEYGEGLIESKRTRGEYPVMGSNGIVGYHNQFLIEGPGIVVGRKGSIGAVSWVDSNYWPIDTTYYIKLKTSDTYLRWLFYKLAMLNLSNLNMATGVPGLNRNIVHSIRIARPPEPEQRTISAIIDAIEERSSYYKQKKQKFGVIKKGLMNDLLTGKRRVKT